MYEILFRAIIGHFLGDFFFQFRIMSLNKWQPGRKGFIWCLIHVFVYTSIVCLTTGIYSPLFFIGVSIPHFFIDRYSLALWWMKLTGTASMKDSKRNLEVSFAVVIYIVLDQMMHFLSLYGLIYFLNI